MATVVDFLRLPSPFSTPTQNYSGIFVRFTDKVTRVPYYSTGSTSSTGIYVINNIPASIYDIAWNLTGNPGDVWTYVGNTYEVVANQGIDVTLFGAKGDGVTDDTVAIQSAITAVSANGGGTIYFPPGTYIISSPLLINSDNVQLLGSSWNSVLFPTAGFGANPMIHSLAIGGGAFRYGIKISDLFLDGNNVTGIIGIQLDTTYQAQIYHTRVRHCVGTGIFMNGSSGNTGAYNSINNCHITDGGAGIGIDTNFNEWLVIEGGLVSFHNTAGGIGFRSKTLNNRVIGAAFDNNDTGILQSFAGRLTVTGCQFDRGVTRFIRLQGSKNSVITGNFFGSFNGTGSKNILDIDDANNSGNIVNGNNLINGGSTWTNYVVENANVGAPGNVYVHNEIGALGVTVVNGTLRYNRGYNPKTGVSTPTFPNTTVAATNSTGVDVMAYITNGTSALTVQVDSDSALMIIPASQTGSVFIPNGSTFTPTYAAGTPTWKWKGQ